MSKIKLCGFIWLVQQFTTYSVLHKLLASFFSVLWLEYQCHLQVTVPHRRLVTLANTSPALEFQASADVQIPPTHFRLSRTWVCLGRAPSSSSAEDVSPSAGRSTGVWTGCSTAFLIKMYTILSGLGLLGGSLSQYPIGYIYISRAPTVHFLLDKASLLPGKHNWLLFSRGYLDGWLTPFPTALARSSVLVARRWI
jgi:hypothetical protein